MRLYLCMVMGGSICTLLYFIIDHLKYEFSLKWKSIFLKMNIIFYLLPVPLIANEIKQTLKNMLEKAGVVFPEKANMRIYHYNVLESMIVKNADDKIIYILGYQKWIPLIIVAFAAFLILLAGWGIASLKIKTEYKKGIVSDESDRYSDYLKSSRRKVKVAVSCNINSPVTLGTIRPIILLPLDRGEYINSEKGILRHEMNHILKMDGIFRFLIYVIIATEWYNPLVYWLYREYTAVSEMLCDEAATEDMSKEEKICYVKSILAAAEDPNSGKTMLMTLGTKRRLTRERMTRIMEKNNKKIWKKSMTAGIVAVCFLFSSIPALAYEKPISMTYGENIDISDENWTNTEYGIFVPAGEKNPHDREMTDFSQSDYVFVSKTGEVSFYEESGLSGQNQIQAVCVHNYVEGIYSEHDKYSDGSCRETQYNAKQCSKCKKLILGSEISTNTYDPCPH